MKNRSILILTIIIGGGKEENNCKTHVLGIVLHIMNMIMVEIKWAAQIQKVFSFLCVTPYIYSYVFMMDRVYKTFF